MPGPVQPAWTTAGAGGVAARDNVLRAELEPIADTRLPADLRAAGYVADASGLDPVRPAAIVAPTSTGDVQRALAEASRHGLRVTVAGTRHAMGGQALQPGALLIETRNLRGASYVPATGLVRVQPGATWAELQRLLDAHGRSVAVMQSSNVFSVGGTLAANAHGRDVRFGPIIDTVESVRVLLADGRLVNASRRENPDLFRRVIGGYGMYGVIVDATLRTVPNELYRRRDATLPVEAFPAWWAEHVRRNPDARLLQARLSIDPDTPMSEIQAILYERVDDPTPADGLPPLEHGEQWALALWEKATFTLAQNFEFGRDLQWWMQQHLDPLINGNKLVTRNQAMSPHVEFLRSGPSDHTQVLQEYFVPREQLPNFVGALRAATHRHRPELLNATIRDVPADRTSALPYAPRDSFSVVLYIDHDVTSDARQRIDAFARDVGAAAVAAGGTMYLPYRLAYGDAMTAAAYPGLRGAAAARHAYDPRGLFNNSISQLVDRVR